MEQLKLIALDEDDLEIVSAHLQDAVLRIGDMAYLPKDHRFAAVTNRFDWAETAKPGQKNASHRLRSALRIDRIVEAKLQGIDLQSKRNVLNLLAIQFEPGVAPAGTITLIFAGDGAIRLSVECIEVGLTDLGPAWLASSRPDHGEPEPGKDEQVASQPAGDQDGETAS